MTAKQILDFSALLDNFCQQAEELSAQDAARHAAAQTAWQQQTDTLNAAANQLEIEYSDTEARRKGWADSFSSQARHWLEELDDPLWQTVKDNCFLQCMSPRAELAGKNEEQLLAYLVERQLNMEEILKQLKGGFIPASMSGVVGKVIPGYKRKAHRQLAQNYTDTLCAADLLRSCGDIARSRAHTKATKAAKQQEYDASLAQQRAVAEEQLRQEALQLRETFTSSLQECDELGLFCQNDPLYPGICFHANPLPGAPLPIALQKSLDGAQIFFPLSTPLPQQSYFLLTDLETRLSLVFISCAMDILQAAPKSQVYFADLEGLGSNYALLAPLTETGRVRIWSSENDIRSGLAELSRRVSRHHTSGEDTSQAPCFLFVEHLDRNIPAQELDTLFRIVKNGAEAGVYVLLSLQKDVVPDRLLAEQLQQLDNVNVRSLAKNTLSLNGSAGLYLCPGPDLAARVRVFLETEADLQAQAAILPLGPRLPAEGCWQQKSSANGIEIVVGDDPNGDPVLLRLNEETSDVLTIGDRDVGKSSLYHTICIQIMANYSPDEVRIAIGDFKMGAEFNTYAAWKLPSVEAVVNDNDPDVMESFLRCYAGELLRRQRLFTALEEQTGELVRKYETYRKVRETLNWPGEPLPRLVILIDEFISLFNNGSGTAQLLSELIRMSRTYGIHLVMASQRAVGDTQNNSFNKDLRDYFSSRFVLRTPQSAARTLLHERCGDTGRENSGIAAAPTLPKGHAVFNDRMGELEARNRRVQCYYPDNRTITTVCQILRALNGEGKSVLLKRGAPSPAPVLPSRTCLLLGVSPLLRRDAAEPSVDDIEDDTYVGIRVPFGAQNLLLTGSDVRMALSAFRSAALYQLNRNGKEVHVFGLPTSPVMRELMAQNDPVYVFHTTEEEIRAELTHQTGASVNPAVNLFVELDTIPAFAQSYSGSRMTAEVELLKQVLQGSHKNATVNLLYARTFRNLSRQMPYAVQAAPIRLTAVGDSENLRAAMPEGFRISPSEFDQPRQNAICAYYCNADTGNWGKVLLFAL